jgi:hypothetical protein
MKAHRLSSQKIKLIFIYSGLVFTVLSCSFVRTGCGFYTKNAEKDNADDIQEIIVSKTNNGTYLTTVEWIFQGKRQTKQGIRGGHDGWWETRLSCYDLSNGELKGRYVFGKRDEAEFTLLGEAGGKLWLATADKNLGFHAREIPTLEIAVTEEDVLKANPDLELDKPEWNYVAQVYHFDKVKKMPVVKDRSGKELYINPSTIKTEIPDEVRYYTSNSTATTSSVNLTVNKYIQFNRQGNIEIDKKETSELKINKGEFLMSTIPVYMAKTPDGRTDIDDETIITADGCLFTLSETSGGDKSNCVISKIKMHDDKSVSVVWQTELDNVYRYPEKVLKAGFFETTFKSGNPNYGPLKVILTDKGLILIYNLKMICIDVDSGEIDWQIEL